MNDPPVLRALGFRVPDDGPARSDGWLFSPRALASMRGFRATFVARARFVEYHLEAELDAGVDQFVVLGAGIDTTAPRRTDWADRLRVFEVDVPATQAWKRARIAKLGLEMPRNLRFVPVDFEANESWTEQLSRAGFDPSRPAVFASTGVSQYLTEAALSQTMREIARLAAGTTFACTFVLPKEELPETERALRAATEQGAAEMSAPWINAYRLPDVIRLAREARFAKADIVSPADWNDAYFKGCTDDLRASSGEPILVARI